MSDKTISKNPFNHLLEADHVQQKQLLDPQTSTQTASKAHAPSRKRVRKKLRKHVKQFNRPELTQEQIEMMSFELRNIEKKRVTADIPEAWRDELYRLALELKVGRYELLGYILGSFLGKTHTTDPDNKK